MPFDTSPDPLAEQEAELMCSDRTSLGRWVAEALKEIEQEQRTLTEVTTTPRWHEIQAMPWHPSHIKTPAAPRSLWRRVIDALR